MADREKVLSGLEHCLSRYVDGLCDDCPYMGELDKSYMIPMKCKEIIMRDALTMLKEQESEWLEDSDPGQEYGTTWACRRCMHSIYEPYIWNPYDSGYKYCPHCGAEMKVKLDE